ncbi:hypothetical protein D3C80_1922860 [compost metagenome]
MSTGQELCSPGIDDDDLRLVFIQGLFHFIAPNRVTGHIQHWLTFGAEHKTGHLTHELSDFSRAMLAAGPFQGHALNVLGLMVINHGYMLEPLPR